MSHIVTWEKKKISFNHCCSDCWLGFWILK